MTVQDLINKLESLNTPNLPVILAEYPKSQSQFSVRVTFYDDPKDKVVKLG